MHSSDGVTVTGNAYCRIASGDFVKAYVQRSDAPIWVGVEGTGREMRGGKWEIGSFGMEIYEDIHG